MAEVTLADLRVTVRITREAADRAARAFDRDDRAVGGKADGSVVTATDLEIEELLRRRLAEHFPGDAVVGEELPATPGTSRRRWVIDPIGGTADFVQRIPLFSIDLAMADDEGPALAVSNLPMSRVVLAGGRGLGSWVLTGDRWTDADRARVDNTRGIDGAVVCAHNLKGWSTELVTAVHQRCRLRDGIHSVRRLITGQASAVILAGGAMSYEDLACLPVLVEQAGGRVTDLAGKPVLDGNGTVLATNGVSHDEFLDLVRGLPTGRV